jgi:uncharacterized membrane protein YfcA
MIAGGVGAGIFGSLLGLGGGVLIVPLLTLGFGLPLREAVGVSLVSVIVTSSASAGVYLQRHVANLRLGMVLELFTATGALVGGLVAFVLPERAIAFLFAVMLAYVALSMLRRREPAPDEAAPSHVIESTPEPDGESVVGRLSGPGYRVRHLPGGIIGSIGAGVMSALLGVGGGTVKVPVMHLLMGVPLRVATATSNLMIGVTATASAIVYVMRGGIDPFVAAPIAVGVYVGATLGSRVAPRIDLRLLRLLFILVLVYTTVEMLLRALGR